MVDFKKLMKMKQAVQEAIVEEEQYRSRFSPEEKRVAQLFFHRGSVWERKQSEVIIHENLWWWGKSFTIIVNGGKGSVVLRIENERPDAGSICSLIVLEEERQKGMGTKLMKMVEELAKKQGCEQVYLGAAKGTFLIPWYRKLGFEIYDENPEGQEGYVVSMNKMI
jgi:N-acetylglutamate synthase-like GNAT family acetyltransferase